MKALAFQATVLFAAFQAGDTLALTVNEQSSAPNQAQTVIKCPAVEPRRSELPKFSSVPTANELFSVRIFPVALIPVGSPTSEESKALGTSLEEYVARSDSEDQSVLLDYLNRYPKSVWKPALLVNLGIMWREEGFFSKSLSAWSEAWDLTRNSTDFRTKSIADRAAGELAQINAWVGRYEALQPLMDEIGGRKLFGGAEEMVADAKDGMAIMNNHPEAGFMCGPFALDRIRSETYPTEPAPNLVEAKSTKAGFSLAELQQLAQNSGMKYQMAKRKPGGQIILNAVVHWKLNHYGALLKEERGHYLISDSTFSLVYGHDLWISRAALEEESDGYFLVPEGELPQGWEKVTLAEGQIVWGKGSTGGRDPNALTPNDITCNCPPSDSYDDLGDQSSGLAMARYTMFMMLASLNVYDSPIWYQPPIGPGMKFKVTYNQRDIYSQAMPNYSNLGAQWTFDWLTYISDQGTTGQRNTVTRYVSGGGQITYSLANATTGMYASDRDGVSLQYISSNDSYVLSFPSGSKEVFSYASSSTGSRNVFLTSISDPAGNTMTISYDSLGRISKVNDALGQTTTLYYDLAFDQYKITRVGDPFVRFAYFQYDQEERLHEIIDMIGIHSAFDYNSGDFITALRTPYGASTFSYTDNGTSGDRSLLAVDPEGNQQFLYAPATTENVTSVPNSDTFTPTNWILNSSLQYRDTFYFDKNTMSTVGTNNLNNAVIYHWLHENDSPGSPGSPLTSGILESIKYPLESRIWYGYPGQQAPGFSAGITLRQPSMVARMVDNPTNASTPSSQIYAYLYNNNGKITQSTDPKGRTTIYDYYPNGIDLMDAKQVTASGTDILATYGAYNSQHRPSSFTNTDGGIYNYSWEPDGQLSQIADPLQTHQNFYYNSSNYLTSIMKSGGGLAASNSFGYDLYGRINTFTNVNNYTRISQINFTS